MKLKLWSIIAGIFLVVTLRVLVGAFTSFHEAKRRCEAGDSAACWEKMGETIRWYVPGNPWVKRAINELNAIAEDQQRAETQLEVLGHIRHNLYAVRSFYQPYQDLLIEVNKKIIVLKTEQEMALNPEQSKPRVQQYYERFYQPQPKKFPAMLLAFHFCFWSWIFTLFQGVKAVYAGGSSATWKYGMRWFGAMLILLPAWLFFLSRAEVL